jgi:uncharacterized protein YdhG (YjbR/CyaY superfamily)
MNVIDKYISGFPRATQKLLVQLRTLIKKTAPEAEEVLSYNMPAYKYNGILVYFAAFDHHIGFYPMTSVIEKFRNELSIYKTGKGSVRFPLDKPLPVKLIIKIIIFRVNENFERKMKKKN